MKDFATKKKALFACLDDASQDLKGTRLEQRSINVEAFLKKTAGDGSTGTAATDASAAAISAAADSTTAASEKNSLAQLNGKESIFKKPELPISRCLKPRRTPDYLKNPHKWMKYTLSDVADLSEHSNTSAAYDLLKQMDERRDSEEDPGGDNYGLCTKIEYKKVSKIKRYMRALEMAEARDADPVDGAKMKGSKLIMPEYVVGQHKEKKRKGRKSQTPPTATATMAAAAAGAGTAAGAAAAMRARSERATTAKLALSHLMETDEDVDCD